MDIKNTVNIDSEWLVEAIKIVKSGFVDRLDKDNIIVYKCGTIIRVDIK